jgi:hypothetical protein
MLQIYAVFSLKTTIHVHFFNIYGHVIKECPFFSELGSGQGFKDTKSWKTKQLALSVFY